MIEQNFSGKKYQFKIQISVKYSKKKILILNVTIFKTFFNYVTKGGHAFLQSQELLVSQALL